MFDGKKTIAQKVIYNAVDNKIFFRGNKEKINYPIKLIYDSWSSNIKKGFNYLKFLDENLDFAKFEMKFIGNSPFTFKNIKIYQNKQNNI